MAPASDRILKRLADAEDLIGTEGIDGTPDVCELMTPTFTRKQLHSQPIFEIPDLRADGLGCQMKFSTCPG